MYIAEVSDKIDIDSSSEVATALTETNGILDAININANAQVILLLGGANGASTHYIYGINNDSTATVTVSEINLMGTITTDISNGIQGLVADNFIF